MSKKILGLRQSVKQGILSSKGAYTRLEIHQMDGGQVSPSILGWLKRRIDRNADAEEAAAREKEAQKAAAAEKKEKKRKKRRKKRPVS